MILGWMLGNARATERAAWGAVDAAVEAYEAAEAEFSAAVAEYEAALSFAEGLLGGSPPGSRPWDPKTEPFGPGRVRAESCMDCHGRMNDPAYKGVDWSALRDAMTPDSFGKRMTEAAIIAAIAATAVVVIAVAVEVGAVAAVASMAKDLAARGFISAVEAGTAAGGAGAAGGTVAVSRWGREGLQKGDWVMKGGATFTNYVKSGKLQPGLGNQFASFSSGRTYVVPKSSVHLPNMVNPANWVKAGLGQRIYR